MIRSRILPARKTRGSGTLHANLHYVLPTNIQGKVALKKGVGCHIKGETVKPRTGNSRPAIGSPDMPEVRGTAPLAPDDPQSATEIIWVDPKSPMDTKIVDQISRVQPNRGSSKARGTCGSGSYLASVYMYTSGQSEQGAQIVQALGRI